MIEKIKIFAFALSIYVVFNILVYIYGEYLIFLPPQPPTYVEDEAITWIPVGNDKIAARYVDNPNSKYTIIYCHGNAEDMGMYFHSAISKLYHMGFSIITFDYRGYGLSSGRPSEKNTYEDIRAVYNYLITTLGKRPEQIILYGYSLGSGVVIDLAKDYEVGGIILEAPFVTAYRVVTKYPFLFLDRYKNITKIKSIDTPLLVLHGKKDDIVPFWHGVSLFDAAKSKKMHLWVDDATHFDISIVAGERYETTIIDFVRGLN